MYIYVSISIMCRKTRRYDDERRIIVSHLSPVLTRYPCLDVKIALAKHLKQFFSVLLHLISLLFTVAFFLTHFLTLDFSFSKTRIFMER